MVRPVREVESRCAVGVSVTLRSGGTCGAAVAGVSVMLRSDGTCRAAEVERRQWFDSEAVADQIEEELIIECSVDDAEDVSLASYHCWVVIATSSLEKFSDLHEIPPGATYAGWLGF
ncbi:hypothetical protein Scep_010162 [Stephania cephalantha]|uniref:Uncharacterized protein n=1 Tax=Stephania cephalantha TaxID=152367 RepID=A0AAP0JUH9_9MAGN